MGESDLGKTALVAIWTVTAVSGAIVLLRLYCKHVKARGLWWDDGMVILSWTTLLVCTILQTVEIQLGFGYHIRNIAVEHLSMLGLLDLVTATLSILSAVWSKTAFAITLLRFMDGWTKKCVWFILVSMNVAMAVSAILTWAQCTPVSRGWDREIPGSCWPSTVVADYNIFSGAYSGCMDLCLAILPWTFIPKLQMRKKEKLGVAVAMSMGIFASAISFVKCSVIPELASGDFTYYGIQLVVWGATETAVTIIAGSIPLLRVLLSDFKKSRYIVSEPTYGNSSTITTNRTRLSRGVTRGRPGSVLLATTAHGAAWRSVGSIGGDSDKENILHGIGDKEIMRKTEVIVEQGYRKDVAEGYELNIFSTRAM